MSRLLRFVKRPAYAILIVFLFLAGAVYALQHLSVNLLPGLNYPLINVVTQYPGVSPENMELLVTRPIELEMQSIRGVRRTSSISTMGISQVTVEFSSGFDLLSARQLVSAALSRLTGSLPPNTNPVIDNLGSRLDQIIGYTFVNSHIPQTELRQVIQYELVPGLHTVHGLSRIDVVGGQREAFTVEPDLQKLLRFDLSIADIRAALEQSNINVSGWYLTAEYHDIPIRGVGQIQTLDDVKRILVRKTRDGFPVFLQDVATVRADYLPEHYSIRGDRLPAVAIVVQKQPDYSTIQVARAVDQKVNELKNTLPEGTEFHKFYDQSEILKESIGGVRSEIILGAILAVLVLHYFLRRWQTTWIVATTIPLSLFFALILMYYSGFSLNMMTLAALTLSVGMVVDDAIIIMENIERMEEDGEPLDRAVIEGTKEIAAADISGTLTTVVVFLPLLFLTGFVGQLVIPFGATISYTLLGSLILSLIVVPILMHWKGALLPGRKREPRLLRPFLGLNDRMFDVVQTHKRIVLFGMFLLLLICAFGVAFFNSVSFIPPIDEGAILIEYHLPPGVSLTESQRIANICLPIILKNPDVSTVYLKIGSPENTYYVEDVNVGEFMIKLQPKNLRRENVSKIIAGLKQQLNLIPGVTFLYHQPTQEKIDESFSGLPAFFGITLTGNNQDSLITLSRRIEAVAAAAPGIHNLINNAKFRVPQIQVQPRRDQIAAYHLSVNEVMDQLQTAFRGQIVSYFVKEQIPIALFVRLDARQRGNIEALRNYPIALGGGKTIPLSQLCRISYVNISPTITHLNGQREITMVADVSGNILAVVHRLKERLRNVSLPSGYVVHIRGQYETLIESITSFVWVVASAVVLVYLILYLQFHSFWQPFVILLKIPLDFLGAFIALLITRQPLSISVAIAFITLVGIAVNNAIVLVDYTNKIRQKGLERLEALRRAVHIRTRPILMTGLTTVFGLLPAAIGGGIGSKIHQPFAITLIGGLLFGIFFSLNLIPALYEGFARIFEKDGQH